MVRELVLEALQELGDGRWAPWEAIAAYVRSDSRAPGVARLIERWAQRAGVEPMTPAEVARRIALETLHVLGIVDLGDPEADDAESIGPTLRITPRGRAFLATDGAPESRVPTAQPSRFLDTQALRVGPTASVGSVIALAPFVEIGGVTGAALDILITPQALSHALSAGFDGEVMRNRLEALAPLPDPIARTLTQASTVIGRAEFVMTQGFLWVEDPEVRELLRTRRQSADLFIDPSPPAGLLLAVGADLERVARRCRALGVEVLVDGEVYRTRSIPPGRGSGARRMDSSGSMAAVRAPSTGGMPAGARVVASAVGPSAVVARAVRLDAARQTRQRLVATLSVVLWFGRADPARPAASQSPQPHWRAAVSLRRPTANLPLPAGGHGDLAAPSLPSSRKWPPHAPFLRPHSARVRRKACREARHTECGATRRAAARFAPLTQNTRRDSRGSARLALRFAVLDGQARWWPVAHSPTRVAHQHLQ